MENVNYNELLNLEKKSAIFSRLYPERYNDARAAFEELKKLLENSSLSVKEWKKKVSEELSLLQITDRKIEESEEGQLIRKEYEIVCDIFRRTKQIEEIKKAVKEFLQIITS